MFPLPALPSFEPLPCFLSFVLSDTCTSQVQLSLQLDESALQQVLRTCLEAALPQLLTRALGPLAAGPAGAAAEPAHEAALRTLLASQVSRSAHT